MDFATWTRALSARGLQVVPPSHPVPVELWALLPAGGLIHFRCRGTRVTLDRYAEDDLLFVESPGRCGCDGGCADGPRARVGAVPPRVRIRPGARPVAAARFDGTRARRWSGHEAGLLTVEQAAPLFDVLLDRLQSRRNRTVARDGSSLTTTASAVSSGRSAAR